MSSFLVLGLLVAGFWPAVLCHPDGTLDRDTPAQEDQDNRTQVDSLSVPSNITDFACRLYKQLALKNPHKNVVFSPIGISSALAFLPLGADSNSLVEILEGLKFNLTETPEPDIHQGFSSLLRMFRQPGDQSQLSMGSTMFIEEQLQLLAKFQEEARALYQAETFTTDFQQPEKAKKLINDYVKNGMQGKIKELISRLDKDTQMVLVNYILFKGEWETPFDPSETLKSKFHLNRRKSMKVPMMKIKDLTTPYFRDEVLSCSVVELKYKGGASALFILPDLSRMQDVEASLNPETLRRWKDSLRPRRIDEFYLPKFSISGDYSLKSIFPQLGIREVFFRQTDLPKITAGKHLKVSQVVHKAVLDVGEMGTEVAATTRVKGVLVSSKPDQRIVDFSRSFLMVSLAKDIKIIISMAKVINPKQA